MSLPSINPTETLAWQNLREHFAEMQYVNMQDMFVEDSQRAERFHIQWKQFLVDYSKNRINQKTIDLLLQLAQEVELKKAIEAQFSGENINQTENRAVLHTALRARPTDTILVNGKNVVPEVYEVKEKIKDFTEKVITKQLKGFTGKPITDIVNIGIGGSDLGPAMVVEALGFYRNHLGVHFVSNVDGDHLQEIMKRINPETTLFVVVSKTFTTRETLSNAETIRDWFLRFAQPEDIAKHFVAVSSDTSKAKAFGIDEANVFPMWDWVGGRFSLWGSVGLTISLAVGYDNFEQLLAGANAMDEHFRTESFENNIPVILALLSVWYNNFFQAETEALIPYTQYLQKFAPYLQQGIMESNGKSIARNGFPVNYQTGTIIWGEPGTNSQHAFFQLIHQGTKLIPVDFIGFKKSLHGDVKHHNQLMSNFFAQTEALLEGKSEEEVLQELKAQGISEDRAQLLLPFKVFDGNKPTNTLLIDLLTPETLGSLIALYEHKIFVQGVIWNIFSYDQWGVELGKQLAGSILEEINSLKLQKHDSSTELLLKNYLDI
ncbi:glucose-6-phosphate isomerase [Flavobacterium luminosum]|uniref:Glucose-6-phosphate isomerase n=1 Tax=Flavobacterium luminosum TaxID=2949086 RepID=A0ABT0TLL7_9FLAO|nr:glucose-6-phosphate isomerase [Flavobacterium sp. HXWNR70]MCL9808245.1 glucose-6-phosphate isomerase [Flavobacterium sp. HXWNR70]